MTYLALSHSLRERNHLVSLKGGKSAPTGGGSMNDQQPSPRVVVVTGATGGIGRATARAFAARGDSVALLARGSTGLDEAAADVREAGAPALPLSVDMAD